MPVATSCSSWAPVPHRGVKTDHPGPLSRCCSISWPEPGAPGRRLLSPGACGGPAGAGGPSPGGCGGRAHPRREVGRCRRWPGWPLTVLVGSTRRPGRLSVVQVQAAARTADATARATAVPQALRHTDIRPPLPPGFHRPPPAKPIHTATRRRISPVAGGRHASHAAPVMRRHPIGHTPAARSGFPSDSRR